MSDEQQAETADEQADAEEVADVEETEAEPADTGADEEAEGGIQEGDFVRLSYTVRTRDDDRVVDTTSAEVAEEAEIDAEDYEFEPRVVGVGEGHVFPSVDEELVGKRAGDEGVVDVPADEAFGEFDPDDVRTVSADKIGEDDRYPGAQVNVDGEQGFVETIIGGRARVDFNHPLAGEDLEYEYEVAEVVDDPAEQAKGMIGMYLQETPELWIQTDEVQEETVVEPEGGEEGEADSETPEESLEAGEAGDAEPKTETETVEKETLYIEATPQMTMNQQWMMSKQQIAQQVMDRLDLDRVIVQETIEGGMMGGMGGMMGGMGGAGGADIEEALDDVDVDADEIVDELDEADIDAEDPDADATEE